MKFDDEVRKMSEAAVCHAIGAKTLSQAEEMIAMALTRRAKRFDPFEIRTSGLAVFVVGKVFSAVVAGKDVAVVAACDLKLPQYNVLVSKVNVATPAVRAVLRESLGIRRV